MGEDRLRVLALVAGWMIGILTSRNPALGLASLLIAAVAFHKLGREGEKRRRVVIRPE